MNAENQDSKILKKITDIELRLTRIQTTLDSGQDTFLLIKDGLQAHRERYLKDSHASPTNSSVHKLYEQIRNDRELRFPHRKILECLIGHYDVGTNQWREVHFSRLVKEARVGKNKGKEYLALLEAKGYVERREDGYRHWFRIKS